MEWLRLIGFCILTAVLVVVIRPMSPAFSGLLCAAFGAMLLGVMLPQIHGFVQSIRTLLDGTGLSGDYYAVMLKAMGIVLVTQVAAQVCFDMDAPSVAQRAELCGRLALLGVAVPVFTELTQMAIDVLR